MAGRFTTKLGRRGLLAGALATGAAAVAGGDRATAQQQPTTRGRITVRQLVRRWPAEGSVPEILTASGEAATAPDFPIGYLGLTWTGADTAGRIRFRTGAGWGPWQPVERHDSNDEDRNAALVAAGGATQVEVEPAPGAGDVQLLAINTTDGPASGLPFAMPSRLYGCQYRNRAGWGADESWRFEGGEQLWPPEYFPVQTLTVHHTATAVDESDPAASVRAVYFFHAVTQGWGDIGYHLLIDPAGVVYEGRYSGPDGWPLFRVAPGQPLVTAGHSLGFNSGNVGVVVLGDFTSVQPTAAARRSLVRVLASLAHAYDLDPLGRTNYVNPVTDETRTVDTISGHRDWNATQCPGNTFYPTLPALRDEVADLLAQGVPVR